MSTGQVPQRPSPPITSEDLSELGVEPQLIPFIVSATLRVVQSQNDSPQFSQEEAKLLVEILDKATSSAAADPTSKGKCSRALGEVASACGILPASYFPSGVTLSDTAPCACGGFADIWRGRRDGDQVCVKAFRVWPAATLKDIKRMFYREMVAWKQLLHPNVIPFLGVSETLFAFSIISPWLPNGNIVDYIQENQATNRLQLLAQAAFGLEYLHSLDLVHGAVSPGNILITEGGTACIGDFGITGIITDPAVVEPASTTTSKRGVVHYMAPELLNPSQFLLTNSNPSKETDVYSLAMSAYETLTGVLPYGNSNDGMIIYHIINGERPPRPTDTRWLSDSMWNMITMCWSAKREQRWDVHTVYNQFLTSSIQEVPDIEPDPEVTQTPSIIVGIPSELPPVPAAHALEVEGSCGQSHGPLTAPPELNPPKRKKLWSRNKSHTPASPPPADCKAGYRVRGKWYQLPGFSRVGGVADGTTADCKDVPRQQRSQKNGTLRWSWKFWRLGTAVPATLRLRLLKNPSRTDDRPSQ